ncbi:bcl-2-like protein 13 [Triplophysa rosa]|nr:bcl-2-like protein 13 [Triplophysa rosa]
MEPAVRNLETSEIVVVSEDQSENHSSTSDIIHLEAGRVESDEEEEDLQTSMMSMLGSEKELAEMRAEIEAESDLRPPETVEILMCVEDPLVEEIELEDTSQLVFTHTALLSEPSDFTLASVPIPEIISQVLEHLPSPQELPWTPSSTLTLLEEAHTFESSDATGISQEHTSSSLEGVGLVPNTDTSGTPTSSFFDIPVLLVGGAALMAVVGVLAFTLNRK